MKTIKATPELQTQAAALRAAVEQLKGAGWMHTHSIMRGEPGDTNYGMCFLKPPGGTDDGSRMSVFYLNRDTINSLPL